MCYENALEWDFLIICKKITNNFQKRLDITTKKC